MTFSEPVWGFTTGDFTLTGPSGAVASAVTFSNGSQTATISHATLTFGATYTATIGTGITDSEGTAMAAPYVWSFAVASAIAPKVTAVFPTDASVGVSRTATIRATFSKAIDDSTIEGTVGTPSTTFLVYTDTNRNGAWDAGIDTAVSGRVDYDEPTLTATFTPASALPYAAYVVRLTTGIEDANDIPLAEEYPWSFSTIPDVDEPIAANNRIVPGGSERVVIFIPQPTANAADKVTVQVFTATGKRVATLVNAESYSALQARLPLQWDGMNGKVQKLGPGLYFIRITAPGYSRVLKVMIVR